MAVLNINGQAVPLDDDPRTTLLDLLRDHAGLTGTKKGCDHGQCGACTLLLDGRRVNACLILAVQCEGSEITTIEGLGTPEHPHAMQRAFLHSDGFQCGYCTPGQICSAVAMLEEIRRGEPSDATGPGPVTLSRDEIRERMSGNLCRCGAYDHITEAVLAAVDSNPSMQGRP